MKSRTALSFLLPIFLVASHVALSQTKRSKPVAQSKAVTTKPVSTTVTVELSDYEKEIIKEINLARANPAKYAEHLLVYRGYYKGSEVHFPGGRVLATNEGLRAVDEAIAFLKAAKALPAYELRHGMVRGARDHLTDLKTSGKSGHRGSDGSLPADRLGRYGTLNGGVGEDIVYQSQSPRDSVIGLIIDDGVANRGHRNNIFKTTFTVIGIALGEPSPSGRMCIITFAGSFIDKPPSAKSGGKSVPTARQF